MKKVVALLGVAALAGTAVASNDFRLDLTLTARSGDANTTITDIQTGGSVNAVVGQTYRVELRYRIQDLVQGGTDRVASRGLSSANIGFAMTGGGTASGFARSVLSNDQLDPSTLGPVNTTAPSDPDASGLGDGSSGLIGLFRGGLTGDTDPANGSPGSGGFAIVPLAIAAPGHQSWVGAATATTAAILGTNNSNVWAVYSFDFVYGGGTVTFTANAIADAGTGNRFGYFERGPNTAGSVVNNPVPQTSQLSNAGSISFIPAPGAAALLGLGGLVAARRRRA